MNNELTEAEATDPELSLLYHYTDAAGLRGIITTGELWATDALCLNDASEVRYVFQLVAAELERMERADPSPPQEALEVVKMIRFASDVAAEMTGETFPFFVVCFCEKKDLLSQWRGYSKGVGGFSLGFRRRELEAVNVGREFGPYKFEQVSYDEKTNRVRLRQHLMEAVESYKPIGAEEQDRRVLWHSVMGGYFGEVGFNSILYKNPGFVEEREWRIVVRTRADDLAANKLLRFRIGPMGIVPYVGIDVSEEGSRRPLIGEIVIGPTPQPELAERSVQMLLASAGFEIGEVAITHSEIPLRA